MPPAWKTFDESTASALRNRLETGVSVESIAQPLFAEGDSVVIAPTLQKGAALVITARRKAAPAIVEEAPHFTPLIEEIAAPEVSLSPSIEQPGEPAVIPEVVALDPPPAEAPPPLTEFTFGPTTWERVDDVDVPAEFAEPVRETRVSDPEIWDLPSKKPEPSASDEVGFDQAPAIPNNQWEEERYVATGFLGLENYVEDDREIARAKRPWWKRIFS